MGTHYVETFRQRDYELEKHFCEELGIKSKCINILRKRMKELNSSNFSSERWFKSILTQANYKGDVFTNYPILNTFYADFYFKNLRLVVEIDGKSHDKSKEYDKRRDDLFLQRGLRTIRIKVGDELAVERLFIDIAGMTRYKRSQDVYKDIKNKKRPKRGKRARKLTDGRFKMVSIVNKTKKQKQIEKEASWNKMMLDALKK